MTNDPNVERRYLLGTASDQERDAVEAEYFDNGEALAAMEDAEDALVEAYLDGALPADERTAFERHYLASPIHHRRVQVARGLRRAARPQSWTSAWSGLGLAAAAVLAFTVAGLVWLSGGPGRPSPDVPTVAEAPPVPPAAPSTPPRTPVVVALTVPSVMVRGPGGPPTARIPADADLLNLRLLIEPGQPPVAGPLVVVETIEGRQVWQGTGATDQGVAVSIPVSQLAAGDYLAVLFETSGERRTERNQYFFRVQGAAQP